MNDELKILPISSLTKEIKAVPFSYTDKILSKKEKQLKELKESNKGVEPVGTLVGLCKTYDQVGNSFKLCYLIYNNKISKLKDIMKSYSFIGQSCMRIYHCNNREDVVNYCRSNCC